MNLELAPKTQPQNYVAHAPNIVSSKQKTGK